MNREGQGEVENYGYDATFEPDIDRRFMCPVCLLVIRNAVQTKCGHRFCKTCLANTHGTLRFSRCPVDNSRYDTIKDVFVDTAFNRDVLSLKVKCSNHNMNCSWKGELRELVEHETNCPEMEVDCSNDCGERHKKRLVVEHLNNCPKRLVSCDHCTETVLASDLLKHQLLVCQRFPVNCTMCGQIGLLRDQVNSHVDPVTGDCPFVIVPCHFSSIGCQHQEKRRDMLQHYDRAVHQHMMMLRRQVALCGERLDRHERHLSDIMSNIEQLLDASVRQGRTLGRQGTDIAEHSRRLDEMESTNYTGQLLWRVHLPSSRSTFQLVSPSFYTGNPGYKFSVILENAGYQHGATQYASVFVQMEQGRYDDQLAFPYSATCHVSLIGQDRSCSTRVHSMAICCEDMPRPSCSAGQSPRKVCLKFVKSEQLFSKIFLAHDTLLLQVLVRDLNI